MVGSLVVFQLLPNLLASVFSHKVGIMLIPICWKSHHHHHYPVMDAALLIIFVLRRCHDKLWAMTWLSDSWKSVEEGLASVLLPAYTRLAFMGLMLMATDQTWECMYCSDAGCG